MTERYGYISIKFPVPPEVRLASALCEACEVNNLEEAQRLVELGANPNLQSYVIEDDGNIPEPAALHHAVRHNNHELITLLLNAGADVNLEYHGGYKPIHEVRWAQLHSEPPWLRKIIQATENINRPVHEDWTVLHSTAESAAPQFVQMLLDHGASVNESSQKYHVLCAAIQSKNPTTFGIIWNLSDKQLFKSQATPDFYIYGMLRYGWYKPDKVACLYDVLDVLDKFTYGNRCLYDIAMVEFGYEDITDISDCDEDAGNELMTTKWPSFEFGDPQFLNINLCDIIRRLHAHGADFSTDDTYKVGIVYLCYKYNICKNIERQYELLDTITELGGDISNLGLIAGVNYPKLAIMILKYSSKTEPIDLFGNTILAKRCDRAFLNHTITLLMLCSPEKPYRELSSLTLNTKFPYIAMCRRLITTNPDNCMQPFFLCINKSESDDLLVGEERRALLQKVDTLLRIDRLPALQELARNKIRLSLKDKTPKEFLKAIEELNVPEYIADIIQCQAPVCSFQEEDLGDMEAPKFPYSELRGQPDASSTSPGTIPQQLQTFQYESNLSPILIADNLQRNTSTSSLPQPQRNCQRQSNEDEEQIHQSNLSPMFIDCINENLEEQQLLSDVDQNPTDTNCLKKWWQIMFFYICNLFNNRCNLFTKLH